MRHPGAAGRTQRGVALILVLWLTVMLTVIAGSFAYGMRNEALAARNTVSLAQARSLADGAIHRTVFELLRPKVSPDVWASDGAVHVWEEDGARVAVSAIDESGKIDLNTAPDALLKGLLLTAGGLDEPGAARLVDAIGDWKDADDLRRPNGAEAADYKAAGSPYLPANAAFRDRSGIAAGSWHDARALRQTGRQPDRPLPAGWRQPGVRVGGHAPRTARCDARNRRHLYRAAARRARGKIAAAAVSAVRIRERARSMSGASAREVTIGDGVSFVREAVVRPGYQQRLMTVLEWQEGKGKILKTAAEEQNGLKVDGTRTQ